MSRKNPRWNRRGEAAPNRSSAERRPVMTWRRQTNFHNSRRYDDEARTGGVVSQPRLILAWLIDNARRKFRSMTTARACAAARHDCGQAGRRQRLHGPWLGDHAPRSPRKRDDLSFPRAGRSIGTAAVRAAFSRQLAAQFATPIRVGSVGAFRRVLDACANGLRRSCRPDRRDSRMRTIVRAIGSQCAGCGKDHRAGRDDARHRPRFSQRSVHADQRAEHC